VFFAGEVIAVLGLVGAGLAVTEGQAVADLLRDAGEVGEDAQGAQPVGEAEVEAAAVVRGKRRAASRVDMCTRPDRAAVAVGAQFRQLPAAGAEHVVRLVGGLQPADRRIAAHGRDGSFGHTHPLCIVQVPRHGRDAGNGRGGQRADVGRAAPWLSR